MRPIGFSTGALAKQDFRRALVCLRLHKIPVVELSALRLNELEPLIEAIAGLDLSSFQFVSFHAPSHLAFSEESRVTDKLRYVVDRGIPVVVHPDVIAEDQSWKWMGRHLLLENMDKRKPIGRTSKELKCLFDRFPESRLCFDIGHARQVDPTMVEARLILESFGDRLAQIHISEVNTGSRHDPLSVNAISAFQSVATLIPETIPIILETLIDQGQSDILTEIERGRCALDPAISATAP